MAITSVAVVADAYAVAVAVVTVADANPGAPVAVTAADARVFHDSILLRPPIFFALLTPI